MLELVIAERLAAFGHADDLDEVLRSDGGARLADEDAIEVIGRIFL